MSLTEFDNGYWYAAELKKFAKEIGITHPGSLRKDELEHAIKVFLKTGRIRSAPRKQAAPARVKDVERRLSLDLPVVVYTNDQETKGFQSRSDRSRAQQDALKVWGVKRVVNNITIR